MSDFTVAALGEEHNSVYDATLPAVADGGGFCETAIYTIDGTTLSFMQVTMVPVIGTWGALYDATLPAVSQTYEAVIGFGGGGEFPVTPAGFWLLLMRLLEQQRN